jgi:hypothetical protein
MLDVCRTILFPLGGKGHFIFGATASGTRTSLRKKIPRSPIWKRLLDLRLGNFEIQWIYRLVGNDGLIKIHIQDLDVVLAVRIIVGRIMKGSALGGIKDYLLAELASSPWVSATSWATLILPWLFATLILEGTGDWIS